MARPCTAAHLPACRFCLPPAGPGGVHRAAGASAGQIRKSCAA
jgi:hypothetical protein